MNEIKEIIERLKLLPNSDEKIKEISLALKNAKHHFATETNYTLRDFLEYKESNQKSLYEALAIRRNEADFIHTPESLKSVNKKFKDRYMEKIKSGDEDLSLQVNQNK